MEHREFRKGEQLWLNGREVTFMEYHRFEYHRSVAAPRSGAAVVRRHDELETRVVPLWKLTRDRAESLARANAIPAPLTGWERPAPTN